MDLTVPRATGATGTSGAILEHERYPLRNVARFTVVTRDRLRFHVQLEHKWKEYTDLETWSAQLIDDRGRVYRPVAVDRGRTRMLTQMWDYVAATPVRNRFDDIVGVVQAPHRGRDTLGSMSLFRGSGDYVFYARDIFTPETRALTLRLDRERMRYDFTWRMAPDES